MNSRYVWVLSTQATERLHALPKRKQRQLLDHFYLVCNRRFADCTPSFIDQNGIEQYVDSNQGIVLTYNVDHAAKTILIAAIETI